MRRWAPAGRSLPLVALLVCAASSRGAGAAGCGHDAACPALQFCDEAAAACVATAACAKDADCALGGACDGARRVCVPGTGATFLLPLDLSPAQAQHGPGCAPGVCAEVTLAPGRLSWPSPSAATAAMAARLDVALAQPQPRALEIDYRLAAATTVADGKTELRVAFGDAAPAFVRSATGSGHAVVELPEGVSPLAITFGLQSASPGAPALFEVTGAAFSDAARVEVLRPVLVAPDPNASRPVEVVTEVLFSCALDVLSAPPTIGVSLLHVEGGARADVYLTRTRLIRRNGHYRTVVRYATTVDLVPGTYRRSFFQADFQARVWAFATPYAETADCQRGERTSGGVPLTPWDSVASPTRFDVVGDTFLLRPDSALLVLYSVAFPEPSGALPGGASLPLPEPLCPPGGCS